MSPSLEPSLGSRLYVTPLTRKQAPEHNDNKPIYLGASCLCSWLIDVGSFIDNELSIRTIFLFFPILNQELKPISVSAIERGITSSDYKPLE